MNLTLMSLFDGSGGFPLAGAMHGIVPVYAAEVEPYPIAVTRSRFPNMRHLGSVTEIKGAELEPVDVVTFGSPCQDLSVAGLQKGIHDGERSNLFFQAVRIIKELRDKDARTGRTNEHIRPRFAVWENVPGAYSSNGGHDFQAVLQALAEVADPNVSIPFPEKGKWTKAGCIVGDGWSIAWRTLDAQFWGVPQRRKRIYLVADFGSERAGEILFECEGVSGHSEPGAAQGQGVTVYSEGSVGGSGDVGLINGFDGYNADITGDISSTLGVNCGMSTGRNGVIINADWEKTGSNVGRSCEGEAVTFEPGVAKREGGHVYESVCGTLRANAGDNQMAVAYSLETAAFMGGQGAQAGSIAYTENCSPTIRATESGSNQVPDVVYCIEGDGNSRAQISENKSPCMKTVHVNCVCQRNTEKSGTLQAKPNVGFSYNFINPVVYDARGNGDGETRTCLTGDHENRVTDYTAVTVFPKVTGALCANSHPGSYTGQDAFNDMLPVVPSQKPPRKWIVRRLTPTECARLQGFPDMHGHPDHKDSLTDDEYAFWLNVRNTHAMINGRAQKQYTREQMLKWYNGLHTDSAEYKMWGNGIALPCAAFVLGQIAIMDGGAEE